MHAPLPSPAVPPDAVAEVITLDRRTIDEIAAGLRDLSTNALGRLEHGLQAMAGGDFTEIAESSAEPLVLEVDDAGLRAVVDVFNVMLQRTQAALDAYEVLRRDLTEALGDQSCLPDLLAALQSLDTHCLSDLDGGLQAMADGDLTRAARPVTRPLRARPGDRLGALGDVFNGMLARSRTALRSYDAVREDLRVALGDQSCLDELRQRLQSLQRHCLRDIEEALEAIAEGTRLSRPIAPATEPLPIEGTDSGGEMAALFNRALVRARASVTLLARIQSGPEPGP